MRILSELHEWFRAEFLNRIDRIMVFRPLSAASLKAITELQLRQIQTRLSKQSIALAWDKKATDLITKLSLSPNEGARKISRVLRQRVEDPLTDLLLNSRARAGSAIRITVRKDAIALIPAK